MPRTPDEARQKIASKLVRKADPKAASGYAELAEYVAAQGATLEMDESSGIAADIVRAALDRDAYACLTCGTKNNPLLVHPVRGVHEEGGENEPVAGPDAVNTTCTVCHVALHELQEERRAEESGEGADDDEPDDDESDDETRTPAPDEVD